MSRPAPIATPLMRISLADLQLFRYTVEAGSITAGARQVHLSLAAASERIQALEHLLRVPLLERQRRGVRVTPAGQALLHHARIVTGQLERLQAEMSEFGQGLRGRVRLLCNTAAQSGFLPGALAGFLVGHPNLDIDLEERPSHLIVEAVSRGWAELGVVADTVEVGGLELLPLCDDDLVLVCPRDHALAARAEVDFEAALDWPMLGLAEGSGLGEHLALRAAELRRPILYRVRLNRPETLLALVGRGVGVSVLSGAMLGSTQAGEGWVARPLRDDWAARRLGLCMRSRAGLTPPSRLLAAALIAHAQGGPTSA